MLQLSLNNMNLSVDFTGRTVSSLVIGGKERLAASCPLFRINLRDTGGQSIYCTAYDAADCRETEDGAVYTGFASIPGLSVQIHLTDEKGEAAWHIEAVPGSETLLLE